MVSLFRAHPAPERGFSLIEMMLVVAIIGVLTAITVPMSSNALRYLKLSGDARNLSNASAVTKMRAAAKFTQARLYIDITGRAFYTQTYDKVTETWVDERGATQLSSTVSFSHGPVTSPPPNTQTTIGPAPACLNTASPPVAVANTACIIFNSRGLPVDNTGSPTGMDAVYVTDGTAVYGVTVAATGFVRLWRNEYSSTPVWSLQ